MNNLRASFDPSLYFVLDPSVCAGRPVIDVAEQAMKGGVTLLQLRDKFQAADVFLQTAVALRAVTRQFNVPLIINDNIDVALQADADGLHIGQDDMSPVEARRRLGPDKILGLTAFRPEHFAVLDKTVIDYTGTGPYAATLTKPDKPVLGAACLKHLVGLSPAPVVGIGGITIDNAADVMRCGVAGIAMMRAISESDDPAQAAQALRACILPNYNVRF